MVWRVRGASCCQPTHRLLGCSGGTVRRFGGRQLPRRRLKPACQRAFLAGRRGNARDKGPRAPLQGHARARSRQPPCERAWQPRPTRSRETPASRAAAQRTAPRPAAIARSQQLRALL
jgi:hypothetical protein